MYFNSISIASKINGSHKSSEAIGSICLLRPCYINHLRLKYLTSVSPYNTIFAVESDQNRDGRQLLNLIEE